MLCANKKNVKPFVLRLQIFILLQALWEEGKLEGILYLIYSIYKSC